MIAVHEGKGGISDIITNIQVESISIADSMPIGSTCSAHCVGTNGEVGFDDGFHVDDVF